MRITRLESENVKRLKAVTITPTGSVVRVGGNNANGKSSCLDSIAYALGGERLCPADPIRHGQEKARVCLTLNGGLTVTRTFTRKGDGYTSKLEVRSADGAKYPSPQAMLDGLVGRLAFDPVAFLRLKPAEQAEAIRSLAGLDLTDLDRRKADAYEERTEANRKARDFAARLATLPVVDAPDDLVSVADLMAEQRMRQDNADGIARGRRHAEDLSRINEIRKQAILRLERDIDEKERELARLYTEVVAADSEAAEAIADLASTPAYDLDEIPAKIRDAESINESVRRKRERAAIEGLHADALVEAAQCGETLGLIEAERERLIREAKLPVPGLGLSEAGVTLHGVPLEQASSAERLKLSLGMGLALNPTLKVILIRDGSLLDAESMRVVAAMAEAAGGQVWVEQVQTGDASFVIVDGEVKGDDEFQF